MTVLRHGPASWACVAGLGHRWVTVVGAKATKFARSMEVACKGTVPEAERPRVALTWQHSFFFGHKGLAHQGAALAGARYCDAGAAQIFIGAIRHDVLAYASLWGARS